MITRPLDLASKLRPEPRGLDWLFFVNGALLVFFFVLFGSRFVLSPGLGVDFALPHVPGASAGARPTTHVITVVNAGQIFVPDGVRNVEQLQTWLNQQARTQRNPSLLIRASADVPTALTARILGMAHAAGFAVTLAAEDANGAERH
ncbi:MAG TPA: biopolymer transporter ExbD [Opitutaceae bacterium]|nr:biopolymer transporter ExbD [Opitutaceae bacterium]